MKWKQPDDIKIYEALGAVADGRIQVEGNTAKVYSSTGNKYYDVEYNPDLNAIMANDNGSYWKGYLGYPSICLLLVLDVLPYQEAIGNLLKGVAWKDINTKFKNDFERTQAFVRKDLGPADIQQLDVYVADLQKRIKSLGLHMLGPKTTPPEGY